MAVALDEDNTNQEEGQESLGGGTDSTPSPKAGASVPPMGGNAPMTAPGAGPAPRQGSTTRPNIRQYVNANQGAGQQIASGIQQKGQEQLDQFGQSVNKSSQNLQATANPLKQQLGQEGSQKIQQAFKDPSAILSNQDQLQQFQTLRDKSANIGAYGEAAQNETTGLQGQFGKLENQAKAAGTETGRFQLLREAFGQPTYNRGQQKLDQLLLQTDKSGAARNLQQNLGANKAAAAQQLQGFGTAAEQQQAELGTMADQRSQEIQKLFGQGSTEGFDQDLSARGYSDIQQSAEQQMEQAKAQLAKNPELRSRLESGNITNADIQMLGLNKGQNIYNLDLGNYINQTDIDPESIDLASVTNPEEFARYRALQQLAGQGEDIFGSASEAGTFKPYEFDSTRLQGDITDKQNKFNTLISQAQQSAQGLTSPYSHYTDPVRKQLLNQFTQTPDYSALTNLLNSAGSSGNMSWQDIANSPAASLGPLQPYVKQLLNQRRELDALNPNRVLGANADRLDDTTSIANPFEVK